MATLRTNEPRPNRKLPQRRSWRAQLPSLNTILRATGRSFKRATPLLLTIVGLSGVAAGAVAGTRWLRTSSRFALREIVVAGNAHVTRDEIVRRAHLKPGRNLFTLPLQAMEQSIAENPWIARVEVARQLPDAVTITVEERRASALIMVDGGIYLADADGRPFKRARIENGDGAGLIVVSGLERSLFAAEPILAAAAVRRAVAIADLWRTGKENTRPTIGEVHLGHGGVTLYTLEGAVAIELGRSAGAGASADAVLTAAMLRFDATWAALTPDERAAAKTIHLDSRTRPDRVTVTLSDPAATSATAVTR